LELENGKKEKEKEGEGKCITLLHFTAFSSSTIYFLSLSFSVPVGKLGKIRSLSPPLCRMEEWGIFYCKR
jgi:hypothetical protein